MSESAESESAESTESAPVDEDFVHLILYQFKLEPVAARGAESGEELVDEGPAAGKKRKRASNKMYRKFNENIRKSESPRELRLKLPFDHFFHSMTTNPLGWMAHVGRCILGVSGKVKDPNPDHGEWEAGTRFVFTPDDPFEKSYTRLTNAVDIAAITRRTQSATTVRDEFTGKLLARDGYCVFTNLPSECTDGAHLIPFARQNWLEKFDKQRGTGVLDANDPGGGLTMSTSINRCIHRRKAAILNLPSPELEMTDVGVGEPDRIRYGQWRPRGRRLVLQWLMPQPRGVEIIVPHNRDAAFKKPGLKNLPSPELLDYVYGANVLKAMGEFSEGFQRFHSLQAPRRPRIKLRRQKKFTRGSSEETSHQNRKRDSDDSPS